MNDAKLAKIEAMLDSLETAAGLRSDMEVISQNDDGTWPEPTTDAELIVELVSFKPSPARLLELRHAELAADVDVERTQFERTAGKARRAN